MTDRSTALSARRAAEDPARTGRFALEVAWADGRTGRYPWGYLRAICACAHCRGTVLQRVESGTAADDPDGPERQVAALQHIGHYALGVAWKDGHQSILPWDYLRTCDPDERPLADLVTELRKDTRLR